MRLGYLAGCRLLISRVVDGEMVSFKERLHLRQMYLCGHLGDLRLIFKNLQVHVVVVKIISPNIRCVGAFHAPFS